MADDFGVIAWHEDGRWTLSELSDTRDLGHVMDQLKAQRTNGGAIALNQPLYAELVDIAVIDAAARYGGTIWFAPFDKNYTRNAATLGPLGLLPAAAPRAALCQQRQQHDRGQDALFEHQEAFRTSTSCALVRPKRRSRFWNDAIASSSAAASKSGQ